MRTAVLCAAVFAVMAGCSSGPDIEEPVRIKVKASEELNTYDGSAHAVDVYLFKVDDPAIFEAADVAGLLIQGQPVPGGFAIERREIAPGKTAEWNIGATRHERYTHIGVVATYKEAKGPVRMSHEWNDWFLLELDPNAILSFTEYDD